MSEGRSCALAYTVAVDPHSCGSKPHVWLLPTSQACHTGAASNSLLLFLSQFSFFFVQKTEVVDFPFQEDDENELTWTF